MRLSLLYRGIPASFLERLKRVTLEKVEEKALASELAELWGGVTGYGVEFREGEGRGDASYIHILVIGEEPEESLAELARYIREMIRVECVLEARRSGVEGVGEIDVRSEAGSLRSSEWVRRIGQV